MEREVKMRYQTKSGTWKIDGYYLENDARRFMKALKTPSVRRIELRAGAQVIESWNNPKYEQAN